MLMVDGAQASGGRRQVQSCASARWRPLCHVLLLLDWLRRQRTSASCIMLHLIIDVWVGKPAAAGGKFIQVLPRASDRCAIRVVGGGGGAADDGQ